MNNLFIILPAIAIVTFIMLWWGAKNAQEFKHMEPPTPKFQPRKVTYVAGTDPIEKPKRKKKRYYNKKKKPAVAENATTEKRPVGRPRKTN